MRLTETLVRRITADSPGIVVAVGSPGRVSRPCRVPVCCLRPGRGCRLPRAPGQPPHWRHSSRWLSGVVVAEVIGVAGDGVDAVGEIGVFRPEVRTGGGERLQERGGIVVG